MTSTVKMISLNPPKELPFDSRATEQTEQRLTLTNITNGSVAFKVKTTAPKAYLVRPSNEMLKKGESVDVQILLQPKFAGKDLPHRFLVQAIQVDRDQNSRTSKYQRSEESTLKSRSI